MKKQLISEAFRLQQLAGIPSINNINESEDHEVAMAQASLKAIISSASNLINKLGHTERNIPAWIQDHITNAENYIEQACQGFHEVDNHEEMEDEVEVSIMEKDEE